MGSEMLFAWIMCVILLVLHVIFGLAEIFMWPRLGALIARSRDDCGLCGENMPRAIRWATFLAINQGVYNLFIAIGFFMCLMPDQQVNIAFAQLFSMFAIMAGLAGAMTGIKATLVLQSLPGAILLGTVVLFL